MRARARSGPSGEGLARALHVLRLPPGAYSE